MIGDLPYWVRCMNQFNRMSPGCFDRPKVLYKDGPIASTPKWQPADHLWCHHRGLDERHRHLRGHENLSTSHALRPRGAAHSFDPGHPHDHRCQRHGRSEEVCHAGAAFNSRWNREGAMTSFFSSEHYTAIVDGNRSAKIFLCRKLYIRKDPDYTTHLDNQHFATNPFSKTLTCAQQPSSPSVSQDAGEVSLRSNHTLSLLT